MLPQYFYKLKQVSMRRIIVHDEINTAYGNRTNELSNDIFQRNFKLF